MVRGMGMALKEGNRSFRTNPIPPTMLRQMMWRVPAMSDQKLVIVFALFPGVTQLDFTGPHQVFSRLPGASVMLASRTGGTVEADGITFAGLRRLARTPARRGV